MTRGKEMALVEYHTLPALRIPERPKGTVALALVAVVGFVGSFGVWASLSTISSAAVAPAMVTVEDSRKVVQHRDGGPVAAVLVKEGELVQKGQPLVRLDLGDVKAEVESLSTLRVQLLARLTRLRAEAAGADVLVFPAEVIELAHSPTFAALLDQERSLFEARRIAYMGNIGLLRQQIEGHKHQIVGLQGQVRSTRTQLALLQEELASYQGLLAKGLVPKPRVLDLQVNAAALDGELESLSASIATAENDIGNVELQIAQAQRDRREEVAKDLSDAEAQLADVEPRLTAAESRLARADLVAPEAGYVHGLTVHSAGAAIVPGQNVLEIVPAGERLVVTADVDPRDIAYVRIGQEVEIHLLTYRLRFQSIIGGSVAKVSADRFESPAQDKSWYEVTVLVNEADLKRNRVTLLPGMPTQALIKTGERTVLQYLLDPFYRFYDLSMKEE
jgi:epimerase transport system membrane fusion protein